MNKKKYIFLSIVLLLYALNTNAQSKKKSYKDSLLHLVHNDSLMRYYKEKNDTIIADTSFKVINTLLKNGAVVQAIIIAGDTSYIYNMNTFNVVSLRPYGDREKDKKFRRLKYHVEKVYPYAVLAAKMLNKYNVELSKIKSKRKRRKLLRMREKELKERFTDVIKKMSTTSGRVLVKLIDRETGESTYHIIKEMRGGFKAFVYQGIGKFYGADLKIRYNPKTNEEDEMIERIVQMIQAKKLDYK